MNGVLKQKIGRVGMEVAAVLEAYASTRNLIQQGPWE